MSSEATKRDCPYVDDVPLTVGFCASVKGVSMVHLPDSRCAPPKNWKDAYDLISFVGATKLAPTLEEVNVEYRQVDRKFPSQCGDMKIYGHHWKGQDADNWQNF